MSIKAMIPHLTVSLEDGGDQHRGQYAVDLLRAGDVAHVWGGWGDPADPRDQAAHLVAAWAQGRPVDAARVARVTEAVGRLLEEVEADGRVMGAVLALRDGRLRLTRRELPGCTGCDPVRHPDAFEPLALEAGLGGWTPRADRTSRSYLSLPHTGRELLDLLTSERAAHIWGAAGYFGGAGERAVRRPPTPAQRAAIDLARRRLLGLEAYMPPPLQRWQLAAAT